MTHAEQVDENTDKDDLSPEEIGISSKRLMTRFARVSPFALDTLERWKQDTMRSSRYAHYFYHGRPPPPPMKTVNALRLQKSVEEITMSQSRI
jgi:hypothetical protein